MKILLIDDDQDDQTLFADALKIIQPSIHCDIAANGMEGLALLGSYAVLPDVVFLDINMPIMDGRETLNAIKINPRLRNLRIVIYSTTSFVSEVEHYTREGVQFMTKPNNFDTLVDLLRKRISDMRTVKQELALPSIL